MNDAGEVLALACEVSGPTTSDGRAAWPRGSLVAAALPGDERAIEGLAALGVTWEQTETVDPHGGN